MKKLFLLLTVFIAVALISITSSAQNLVPSDGTQFEVGETAYIHIDGPAPPGDWRIVWGYRPLKSAHIQDGTNLSVYCEYAGTIVVSLQKDNRDGLGFQEVDQADYPVVSVCDMSAPTISGPSSMNNGETALINCSAPSGCSADSWVYYVRTPSTSWTQLSETSSHLSYSTTEGGIHTFKINYKIDGTNSTYTVYQLSVFD